MVNRPPPAVAWSRAQRDGVLGRHGLGSGARVFVHGLVPLTTGGTAALDHVSLPASNDAKPAALSSRYRRAVQTPAHGPNGRRAIPARAATSATALLVRWSDRNWPRSMTSATSMATATM